MKTKYLLIALAISVVFSCKRNQDNPSADLNFLINNEEIESLGYDFDEDELSLYTNDPDKVFFTNVGESIEFKDISIPVDNAVKKWYIDSEEWVSKEIEIENKSQFSHNFTTPGLYKIRLESDGNASVTKFVRVLDASKKSDNNSSASSIDNQNNSDIGDFEVFDFSISNKNPAKWEAIVLEDISKTDNEITKRLWDFGDGTIIPTKGSKVKYSYARSGVYEVKMCVNLTNNCKRKRIVVSEVSQNSKEKVSAPIASVNKTESRPIVKADVSNENTDISSSKTTKSSIPNKPVEQVLVLQNLGFDLPSKVQAGLPVRMKDLSFPDEAIKSRSWFIDGVKQYFHQRTVNHIFDTPGTFEIKMCLNKKRDQCVVKTINVYQNNVQTVTQETSNKKTADKKNSEISFVPIISKPTIGLMCQSYGKAGLKSKYKCNANKDFFYGNAIINITPKINLELQNAEIYGETDGYMDVLLLDSDFTELGTIKNVQVLPGYSTLEFGDLGFTLEKDKKYSILLKPKSTRKNKIGLENAYSCKVPLYNNEELDIEYQGKAFVLYDLKYCF